RRCFGGLRRQQFSAQIQSPKDFTLRQGGKRSDGRSIQKYVTEFTSAGNAADAIKNCVQSIKEFAWRH
ncbi:hypothetical protein, partial [Salmonella enterica]|uniref:hypothetical protein n=1 Tax=Salmonella enterica TaxID=28901 RepID=UPI001EE843F3